MKIAQAFEHMERGDSVARRFWPHSSFAYFDPELKRFKYHMVDEAPLRIRMPNYYPTQADMLADDWIVCP